MAVGALKKGDRVVVEPRPEWGIGQVLTEPSNGKVEVYFANAGPKVMSLYGPLKVIVGEAAKSGALDNLRVSRKRFISIGDLQSQFLREFPGGFAGEKYLEQERNYKVAAHLLAEEVLKKNSFDKAIASGSFDSLCEHILRVAQKTNLIFPNEKIKLSAALKHETQKANFCRSLAGLLFGAESFELRFVGFCEALKEMEAAKWTIATYFPFILYPADHMFLKPLVTERAADVCNFELNYKPQLNWLTYQRLQDFSRYLLTQLSELKPHDMIDVQSFIWLTGEQQTKEAT